MKVKLPKKGASIMLGYPPTRERYRQIRLKMHRQFEEIQALSKKLDEKRYLLYHLKPLDKKHCAVVCLDCGWIRASFSVHDYQTCPCPNQAMVDGGYEYTRFGAMDMSRVQLVTLDPKFKESKRK